MELQQVTLNGEVFSKYECKIAVAIKLYIRNSNNQTPSDESLGYVINSMRGIVGGEPMCCYDIVNLLQRHPREDHRSIYLSVYCDKKFWEPAAREAWMIWLRQNDELVQRLKDRGELAPFLNADGTLKT
ncbi:hypothetical protein MMC28_005479 [Mycoblastus sanguinarius]|nr:hypothetical protein [Mycoblastus sanguinarius]